MKTTNKFLTLAIMAVAIVFTACSKDEAEPTNPGMEGTLWYKASQPYDTDKIDVLY